MAQSQKKKEKDIDNHYINSKYTIAAPRRTPHLGGFFMTKVDRLCHLLVYMLAEGGRDDLHVYSFNNFVL